MKVLNGISASWQADDEELKAFLEQRIFNSFAMQAGFKPGKLKTGIAKVDQLLWNEYDYLVDRFYEKHAITETFDYFEKLLMLADYRAAKPAFMQLRIATYAILYDGVEFCVQEYYFPQLNLLTFMRNSDESYPAKWDSNGLPVKSENKEKDIFRTAWQQLDRMQDKALR